MSDNKYFIEWLRQYDGFPLPNWNDHINIIGIRNEANMSNDIFNDVILLQIDNDIFKFKATTDPGKYYTENATKEWGVSGVAHLIEGWYPKTYCLGNHMGKQALVQYGNAVTIWRDVNKNFRYDSDIDETQTGYFGINIHYTKGDPKTIGRWSAGCQVIQYSDDFELFMEKIRASKEVWFNYLLLNKNIIPKQFESYTRA